MALQFIIKAFPKSSSQKLVLDESNMIKCYIKSAPDKGKANQEIIKMFSKLLGVPQLNIEIIKGQMGRIKTISIVENMTYNEMLKKLNLFVQQSLF